MRGLIVLLGGLSLGGTVSDLEPDGEGGTLSVRELLAERGLWTAVGAHKECGRLVLEARAQFLSWQLDDSATIPNDGIYALSNPRAPRQMILLFLSAEACSRTMGRRRAHASPEGRSSIVANKRIRGIEAAKELLTNSIYKANHLTFFFRCPFDVKGRLRADRCESQQGQHDDIVPHLQWQQVVAVPKQAYVEADLYNWVPVAKLSGRRAWLPMRCATLANHKTLPSKPDRRGDVARIWLYMAAAHPDLRLISSRKCRNSLHGWASVDPVDTWECERGRRVQKTQGNKNPFVAKHCGQDRP